MGNKLYVGNLSYSIRDDELQQAFAPYGTVASAKVMMDRDTGRSKGFGFVEMGSDAEAQSAINAMNGTALDGRAIVVNEARPREERPGGFGGGGGGRSGGGGYGGGGRSGGGGGYGGSGGGGGYGGGGWRRLRRWWRRSFRRWRLRRRWRSFRRRRWRQLRWRQRRTRRLLILLNPCVATQGHPKKAASIWLTAFFHGPASPEGRRGLRPRPAARRSNQASGRRRISVATTLICHGMTR